MAPKSAKDPASLAVSEPYFHHLTDAPVFHVQTLKDFRDPSAFINQPHISKALQAFGMIKVITPTEWNPTDGDKIEQFQKFEVIHQSFGKANAEGSYVAYKEGSRPMGTGGYVGLGREVATKQEESWKAWKKKHKLEKKGRTWKPRDEEHQKYWRTLEERAQTHTIVHYAPDITGSLMRDDLEHWNFTATNYRFTCLTNNEPTQIDGVSIPYLYVGSYGATFAWHTEDVDFFSVNYLHEEGDSEGNSGPKIWYALKPADAHKMKELMKRLFPDVYAECANPSRHKAFVIDPLLLVEEGIEVFSAIQKEGEMIITAPNAFHSGFNAGFNIAEARNVATRAWIPIGLRTERCSCLVDSMDPVPKEYVEQIAQREAPEEYEKYLQEMERKANILCSVRDFVSSKLSQPKMIMEKPADVGDKFLMSSVAEKPSSKIWRTSRKGKQPQPL